MVQSCTGGTCPAGFNLDFITITNPPTVHKHTLARRMSPEGVCECVSWECPRLSRRQRDPGEEEGVNTNMLMSEKA